MNKNIFISTRPDNYQNIYNPNDSNALNMDYSKNKKLSLTGNVELRHFFPENTSMDKVLYFLYFFYIFFNYI